MASVDIWVSNQVTLRFGWWQNSQSIANNSSEIGWHLQLVTSGGSISSSASKSWNVTVNGSNYSGTCIIGVGTNTTKTLTKGTTTIYHNADGTKSFSFSFSLQFDINYSGLGWIGTKSGSGSGTLSTIPRTSSVSATNANIGENINITINRASSSFTHTLTYAFCSLSGTIATKTSSTSISWTLPTSFYTQIPNSRSSWGRVICDTYSGSTKIGSSECRFDVYVEESTNKPGISAAVIDVNETTKALTGDENKLVKYYSTIQFSITSSPKNNAGTKSINFNYNGSSYAGGSGNSWTGYFSNITSGSYYCSVTDTRDFTSGVTVNKTLIDYVPLTCAMSVSNPTASGECTVTVSGNYFNGSFGATNNTLTVQYRIFDWDWQYMTATFNGSTYTATARITGLDYTQLYWFEARAIDKLAEVWTQRKYVKSSPIFDWGSNDVHFHVPIYMTNGIPIYGHDPNGNARQFIVAKDGNTDIGDARYPLALCSTDSPKWWNGSNLYILYSTGNKPTPSDIGALGNSGSQTLDVAGGKLTITGNNGYGHIDITGGFHTRVGSEDIWFERHLMPASSKDSNLYIGYFDKRWKMVYATNGTIQTSDKRHKAIIDNTNNEDCFNMVKNTDVFSYVMLNKSKNEMTDFERVEETLMNSGKEENIQMGIMAQDILNYDCSKYILTHSEFTDEETGEQKDYYGINDYAFTSSIMAALKQEITYREELEEKVKTLEERLAKIESLLNN